MSAPMLRTSLRSAAVAVAIAAIAVGPVLVSTPAQAWWHHGWYGGPHWHAGWGWHAGWHRGWGYHRCCWGPRLGGPPVVVVRPPPVVYAPGVVVAP